MKGTLNDVTGRTIPEGVQNENFSYMFRIFKHLFFFAHLAWGDLIPEPALETQLDWDIAPNGLLYVSYDLDGNNRADFIALRSIITSYYSPHTLG